MYIYIYKQLTYDKIRMTNKSSENSNRHTTAINNSRYTYDKERQ